MSDDAKYALPKRWLYKLCDRIIESGERPAQQGILTKIIQDLNPDLYQPVLRSIIKDVYASGDEIAAGRLSLALVRGHDHIIAVDGRV